MNKRNLIITSSSIIVISGLAYVIYSKIRNKKELDAMYLAIKNGNDEFGTIEDFSDILTGAPYVAKMKAAHKKLILLKDEFVTKFRKELYDAISGLGTDTEAIKNVFSSLKDHVHIAQVAESYKKNYDESLLSALNDDIASDEPEMEEITTIIRNKPAYRVAV